MMQPTLAALRAITSEYLKSALKPLLVIGLIITGMLLLSILGLAFAVDVWWLAAILLIAPLSAVGGLLGFLLWTAAAHLAPKRMSKDEREAVRLFTEKIQSVVERVRTPWPVTVMSVAKDVLMDRESRTLTDLIQNSQTLRSDFTELQKTFAKN